MVIVEFCPKSLLKTAKRSLVGLLLFASVALVANCGCLPASSPQTDVDKAYIDEIVACAATAGYPGAYDYANDMRCRAAVDCKYLVGPCK